MSRSSLIKNFIHVSTEIFAPTVPVPYRAARDPKGAKYFSHEADARSAIEHWLVQSSINHTMLIRSDMKRFNRFSAILRYCANISDSFLRMCALREGQLYVFIYYMVGVLREIYLAFSNF